MSPVFPLDQVPLQDPQQLDSWIRTNSDSVTPLIIERLLSSEGFVEDCPLPTRTSVRCFVWKHARAEDHPALAGFRFTVYYTETLTRANVSSILSVLDQYRAWKVRTGWAG